MALSAAEQQIADDLLSHTLDLFRLDASIRNESLALLQELQGKLKATLAAGDLTTFSRKATQKLLDEASSTIDSYYKQIQKVSDEALAGIPGIQAQAIRDSLVGVGYGASLAPPTHFATAMTDILIQGAPSVEWWSRQSADTQFRFSNAVRQGIVQGKTNQQIIQEVIGKQGQPGILEVSRRNATALVQTSVQTVANVARLESFKQNADIIKGVQQLSTLDSHTTVICIAYSGLEWDLEGKPIKGTKLGFNGGPPRHWNCRSVLIPVTKSFEELGITGAKEKFNTTRASSEGQIDAKTTFDGFLTRKGTEYQDKMLGKGRAQLWRDKKITLQQLLDQKGNPISLAELQDKYKVARTAPVVKAKPVKTPKASSYEGPSAGTTQAECEAWAKANGIARNVNYNGIHPEIANEMNNALAKSLKEFPRAAEKMEFVGSCQERDKLWNSTRLDFLTIRGVRLGKEDARSWAEELLLAGKEKPREIMNSTTVWAQAWNDKQAGGVTFNNFFGKDVEALKISMVKGAEVAWHPEGTGSIEGIVVHEFGHIMDYLVGGENIPSIVKLYEKALKTPGAIKSELSEYAATNINEFIAEAWSEAQVSPNPRPFSIEVSDAIKKAYRSKFRKSAVAP